VPNVLTKKIAGELAFGMLEGVEFWMAYKTSEITREQLIRAGEWLLARRGIGGVSAREIAKRAQLRNNYSVAYHFGSVDGLIRSIVGSRVLQLEGIRQAMIDTLQGSDKSSLQFWLECLLFPHIQARDEDGFHASAAILCQYLPIYYPKGFPWRYDADGGAMPAAEGNATPAFDQIIAGLRQCIPDLPIDTFDRRLTNASLLFLNVLVGLSRDERLEALGTEHPLIKDALRQAMSVLMTQWCK
jgi:AcrR family transcriptional regulator